MPKSLFDVTAYREVIQRIETLTHSSTPLWGKMDVAQMLSHCAAGMEMALGDRMYKQQFMGKLIAPFMKQAYYNDKPFARNLPTHPSLKIVKQQDFDREAEQLKSLVKRFHQGGTEVCTKGPHPMFGHYTPHQWASGMYKHLDHHLRQFGV
ncbi:MAG: DUF1569 domain-containing protein [Bacteroidota bacterium]